MFFYSEGESLHPSCEWSQTLEIFFRILWKNKKEKKNPSPLEKTEVDGEAPVKLRWSLKPSRWLCTGKTNYSIQLKMNKGSLWWYLSQPSDELPKTANGEIHTETERLKCPVVIPKQKLLTTDCIFLSFSIYLLRARKELHSHWSGFLFFSFFINSKEL